jgi:hypothetical protein
MKYDVNADHREVEVTLQIGLNWLSIVLKVGICFYPLAVCGSQSYFAEGLKDAGITRE